MIWRATDYSTFGGSLPGWLSLASRSSCMAGSQSAEIGRDWAIGRRLWLVGIKHYLTKIIVFLPISVQFASISGNIFANWDLGGFNLTRWYPRRYQRRYPRSQESGVRRRSYHRSKVLFVFSSSHVNHPCDFLLTIIALR